MSRLFMRRNSSHHANNVLLFVEVLTRPQRCQFHLDIPSNFATDLSRRKRQLLGWQLGKCRGHWNNNNATILGGSICISRSYRPPLFALQQQGYLPQRLSFSNSVNNTPLAEEQLLGKEYETMEEPVANPSRLPNRKQISSSSTKTTEKFPFDATNLLEYANELCNETIYPISAFADEKSKYQHFMKVFRAVITEAQRLVQSKYHVSKNTSGSNTMVALPEEGQISDIINLAFQLILRISREPWKTTNHKVPLQQYYKPQYTNMLLQVWNIAALHNEANLLSAYDVTQLVKRVSYKHLYSHNRAEQPRYDPNTITMLLQVALHEARDILVSPTEPPPFSYEPAKESLESTTHPSSTSLTMQTMPSTSPHPKELVVDLYNALVKSHAESNNKDKDKTVKIIYGVMEEMRVKYFVKPNTITYNILLRFLRLSNSISLESFQFAFQKMQLDKISPNMSTYNEVVQCYTTKKYLNQQQLDIVEQYIQQMIEIVFAVGPIRDDDASVSNNTRQQYYSDVTLITNCAQSLMDAYARDFIKQPSTQGRQEIISKAKGLFLRLDKSKIFSGTSTQELYGVIMDMHGRCGNLSAAKMILTEMLNPTSSFYWSMIKTYGEADRIDDSIEVFHSMLNDQRVAPNILTFNVLLNAFAISKSLGHKAFDRATELVNLLSTNDRCIQLRLQPDRVTYNTLLKCLTKVSTCKEDAGKIAESILLEMEERQKADDQIKPNLITFNLAISACLLGNDHERMNALMNKMEHNNLKADARICNTILNHYAQTGTFESAERAESFFANFQKMGQADISMRPNIYTYNILLNAWGRSNHLDSAQRMMTIYKSMLSDKVTPDSTTYRTLLFHLSKMPNTIGLADKLLEELENNKVVKHHLGYDSYAMLIKAYINYCDAESGTRLLFRWFAVVHGTPTKSKKSNLAVDSMTPLYHQLAQLWIQLGDVERATTMTETIYDLYMNGEKEQTILTKPERPSISTYILLHHAWNKSNHQSKEKFLTKMKERINSYQQ